MALRHTATIWLCNGADLDDEELEDFLPLLGDSEMQRYERYIRSDKQRQFLIGRVLLRQVMGSMLGVPAASFAIVERKGQAPMLTLNGAPLSPYFSLAHSGPWSACAVSANTPLGLDIEVADPGRGLAELARHVFSPASAPALPSQQAPVAAFYRSWNTQEARYKLGECMAPSCIGIPHAQLTVVMCSAYPFDVSPLVRQTQLMPELLARRA